jgi:hypothetical protein
MTGGYMIVRQDVNGGHTVTALTDERADRRADRRAEGPRRARRHLRQRL